MVVIPADGDGVARRAANWRRRESSTDRRVLECVRGRETEDPVAIVASLGGPPAPCRHRRPDLVRVPRSTAGGASAGVTFTRRTRLSSALRIHEGCREKSSSCGGPAPAVDRVVARLRSIRFSGRSRSDRWPSRSPAMTVEEGHDVATFQIVASGPQRSLAPSRSRATASSSRRLRGRRLRRAASAATAPTPPGRSTSANRPPSTPRSSTLVRSAQQAGVDAAARAWPQRMSIERRAGSSTMPATGQCFIHRTGHGIGLDGPRGSLPRLRATAEILEPGMAFSDRARHLPARPVRACGSRTSSSAPRTVPSGSTVEPRSGRRRVKLRNRLE